MQHCLEESHNFVRKDELEQVERWVGKVQGGIPLLGNKNELEVAGHAQGEPIPSSIKGGLTLSSSIHQEMEIFDSL